jgi:ankyrin repeat protein
LPHRTVAVVTVCFQSKDKHGITAILAAIWEGHKDCVKILLANGASKNGVAPDGKSYVESADNNEIRQLLS